jgi:uncharacterized protein DUF839
MFDAFKSPLLATGNVGAHIRAKAPRSQQLRQIMRTLEKAGLLAALLMSSTTPTWADGVGPFTNSVASASAELPLLSPANVYSTDFSATVVASGTDPLENPSGLITTYGKLSNGTNTEPDQNVYLTLPGKVFGPTPRYNYGHHFLFQGHENAGNLGYVTRINLDVADPAHRITLLTPVGLDGLTHLNRLDGSAYDPYTKSLLFAQEGGPTDGGVVEVSLGWPATVTTRYGFMGQCGLEGIHTDNKGRIYMVEDTGGTSASVDPNDINGDKRAKQPNSYIYRFIPSKKNNLGMGGKLQALQVSLNGTPLVFGGTSAAQIFADVWSPAQLALHNGTSYPTKWIQLHDTAIDGTAPFDCNGAARNALATPFKRPENGAFRPDGTFRTFFFTITGDTDNRSGSVAGLAARGAWGGIFELDLDHKQDKGNIHLFALGDATHNSFDNMTFGDSQTILATEDRGDTLHDQLDALDSYWAYSLALTAPKRVIAQGRDVSATPAASEDNEVTGGYVANGDHSIGKQYGTPGHLGAGARAFFTQQHGDNVTYELTHN